MPLDKEKAQDLIDDFVLTNDDELHTMSSQNPALFDATLNALNFLSSRFGTGEKMQLVEKPREQQSGLPFKNGDKFTVPGDKNGWVYTLEDTDITKGLVKIRWWNRDENKSKSYYDSIESVTKRFNDGHWVLVEWYPFKVGDKFVNNNNKKITFTITDIDLSGNKTKEIEVLVDNYPIKNIRNYELQDFIDNIELGFFSYIKDEFTFKVGDVFRKKNSNDKGFKIKEIDGDKFVFESLTSNMVNDDLYTTTEANKKLLDGNWEKIQTVTQPTSQIAQTPQTPQTSQDNPHEIKVGDLIVTTFNDAIWEVLDVNVKQDSVKLMTSSNKKETETLSVLNIKIDDGDNEKLSFSMFDGFVTPNGDFFKIMELYPNNEKSVWVKVNDKPDLEVFQWDIIQAWIEDAYWMPGTKADADQIKADVLKAEEEAKAPKKKLTKLEKQIKDLQEEIDGLLFLADEDSDAKAELEKKLMQIEALKAKKP